MSAEDSSERCYDTAWRGGDMTMRRRAVDELARRAGGNPKARAYLEDLADKDMGNDWRDNEIIGRARSYKGK